MLYHDGENNMRKYKHTHTHTQSGKRVFFKKKKIEWKQLPIVCQQNGIWLFMMKNVKTRRKVQSSQYTASGCEGWRVEGGDDVSIFKWLTLRHWRKSDVWMTRQFDYLSVKQWCDVKGKKKLKDYVNLLLRREEELRCVRETSMEYCSTDQRATAV